MKTQLLLITLLLTTFFSFGQVPTSERDALIALYNSTDGVNWTNNTNWNTANPVSSWFGIIVVNISGQDHVTEIHFNNNNLNGTLPVEIGDLVEIINIDIIFNNLLTGSIPSQIGNLSNLEQLSFWDNDLTGNIPVELGNCTSLTTLSFEDNQLTGNIPTALDNLKSMTSFWLNGNQLSGDIPDIFSSWTNLGYFSIGNANNTSGANNNFTGTLYLSNNNVLKLCWVDNTLISTLNIQNGNNSNTSNGFFKAQNNPNLTCVFVDDTTYSATNWTNIDTTVTFLETQTECDALYTSIPDDNFEQALIDLGLDNILDNKVKTNNINNLANLDVKNKSISDLTGINDFIALSYLNIGNNNISVIDLSNNVNLTGLYCYSNNLTNLSLNNNLNLTVVNCSGNELTEINLSNNLALVGFYCALNNLTSLDLSLNDLIDRLWCYDNNFTEIDIRNGANNLLSGTFTSGTNTYAKFRATENLDLTCIYVDNTTDANSFVGDYLNWEIDTTSTFVETEIECSTLGVYDESFKQKIELFPNPTSSILYIKNNENIVIEKVTILNTLGQIMKESPILNSLDISNLPNGIYYVNFESIEGNKSSFKVMKK